MNGKKNLPSVEISSEHITDDLNIYEVRDRYNKFMKDSKGVSEEIGDVIDEDEIKDIATLISRFTERLEGATQYVPQSDSEKVKGKTIEVLSQIPFIGKFLEGDAEDVQQKDEASQTAKEILKEMFIAFNEKSEVLELSYIRAENLRKLLTVKDDKLEIFSIQVKYLVMNTEANIERILAIKLGGLVEANKLKNKEKIKNKLDFILQFIEEQLTTIAFMLPGIESGLEEDTEIGTFLTSVSEMNKNFKSLINLSNSVGRSSSNKVLELIDEVNNSMTDVVDIDHMDKLAQNNEKYMKKMIIGTENKIRSDAKIYGKMLDIGVKLDENILAYKESSQKVLSETASYMSSVESSIDKSIIDVEEVSIDADGNAYIEPKDAMTKDKIEEMEFIVSSKSKVEEKVEE